MVLRRDPQRTEKTCMVLLVPKPERCLEILTDLGSSADGEIWWIGAVGKAFLFPFTRCSFPNRYLKKCRLQCIFQAT